MAKKDHFQWFYSFISSKWFFWMVTAILVFILISPFFFNSKIPSVVAQNGHPSIFTVEFWLMFGSAVKFSLLKFTAFISGVAQSIVASLWVGWFLYRHPGWITRIFRPAKLNIRVPISMSSAPIIFGKKKRLWDNHNISLDVDFRNTGKQALEDMRHGEYDMAIASDYAICCFLNTYDSQNEFRVLPFALMHNQLKLLAHRNHPVASTAALKAKAIAYWPSSIHAEFLEREGLVPQPNTAAAKDPSLLNFFTQTASGNAAACVLIEPYWVGFDKWEYEEIPTQTSIDWYMCIVFKESLLEERKGLKSRLLTAVNQACVACVKHWDDALKSVADYVLQEFTGIDYDLLKHKMTHENVKFGIPKREDFHQRIASLENLEPTKMGARTLRQSCLL